MPERRPDVAPFKTALYSAITTWWAAEGSIVVGAVTYARPPLVFPNSGYSPGVDPAFVEFDWLPGVSTPTGNVETPIKLLPAILQSTLYVQEGIGDQLLDMMTDRIALMFREISVQTLHPLVTDDPVPAPAPPPGFYGQTVRTDCLRITQPVTA